MKKNTLQKKWSRMEAEEGWTAAPKEALEKTKSRNTKMKAERDAKDGKINMRVLSGDLEKLKQVAAKKGVGYQTLLGMIIHQYINGTLIDIDEAKKILKVG